MKGKYLLWKFAFVLLLVALSLWSVLGGNGLKMGPDIAGGYSMIFEVYNEEGRGDLIERVIAVLKKRIDPTGLSSLEWRPLKNDRFEVRMPAASEASQARRSEYLQALDTLLAHNVERSEIRRLLPMDAPARAAQIRELAGKDAERAERLDALLTAMDALSEAERNLQAVDEKIGKTRRPTKQQLAKLQKERNAALQARDAAAMTYRQRWEALRETNVNPREFQAILKLYDEARAQSGSDAKRAAQKTYESRLASYKKQHPAWEEQITLAANRYEDWARVRRDLEDPSD